MMRYRITLVCLIVSIACPVSSLFGQRILMDDLGYRPADPKIAFVRTSRASKIEITELTSNRVVFSTTADSRGSRDLNTGDTLYPVVFTSVRTPGAYRLWITGNPAVSREFMIASDVYQPAALASLQSYYYQRCGTAVSNGTSWQHPPCHMTDAAFYDDPSKTSVEVGGWHDAGDYGKFVATGALSAAFLLYLYESQPSQFSDGQLSIPERNNGVPDLLDEVRWELEWLLKMQREDGGVYHKVSTKKWTGEYLPNDDPDKRYIFDVSTTATGSFGAVTALGARVFARWDPAFADRLLRSSVKAWQFLDQHPDILPAGGFHNPPDVEGGEYGDPHDADERLWAAVELYRTTSNEDYHRYFLEHYQSLGGIRYPVSWQQVQNFAYYSYLAAPPKSVNFKAKRFILSTLLSYCEELMQRIEKSGYRFVLKPEEYYWGSNSVALGYAFDLLQAYIATGSARYLGGALDQLHYMLGRNPFAQTFVTGVGMNPVRHPYHQFSMMLHLDRPVPGMVVGGANMYSRLNGKILSAFPGKCYEDNEKNYFVNEVAINYTAPFAYVATYISNLDSPHSAGLTTNHH